MNLPRASQLQRHRTKKYILSILLTKQVAQKGLYAAILYHGGVKHWLA